MDARESSEHRRSLEAALRLGGEDGHRLVFESHVLADNAQAAVERAREARERVSARRGSGRAPGADYPAA